MSCPRCHNHITKGFYCIQCGYVPDRDTDESEETGSAAAALDDAAPPESLINMQVTEDTQDSSVSFWAIRSGALRFDKRWRAGSYLPTAYQQFGVNSAKKGLLPVDSPVDGLAENRGIGYGRLAGVGADDSVVNALSASFPQSNSQT